MDDLSGQTVGAYQLVKKLGQGGMASVYRAHHPALDRWVAVKVLAPDVLQDPEFLTRFTQEARTLAKLSHPNILPVYDFGDANNPPYIVMQLMPSGTLADRLRNGILTLPDVLRVIAPIAAALSFIHSKGFVHRDVKPSNILFDEWGTPFLADFGIAKGIANDLRLTDAQHIVGTPTYMSPEQARGDPLDACSDVYSLGVVVYEAVVGYLPFQADTPLGVGLKHITESPRPPREFLPELSEAVEAVILRALAKQLPDRYPSAVEFAQALAEAAHVAQPAPVQGGEQPAPKPAQPGSRVTEAPISPSKAAPDAARLSAEWVCGYCGKSLEGLLPGDPCPVCNQHKARRKPQVG
jgi:serine/threonine-protein kinase